MQKNWILIIALIALLLLAGCTSPPASSPGSTPSPVSTTPAPAAPAAQTPQSPPAAAGAIAKTGESVSVYYTGRLDNGTVFDSNENGTPLTFTLGQGMVIPGFEKAVLGMGINESKTVFIPSGEAYGAYDPSLVQTVNRSLTNDMVPVVGQYVMLRRSSDGASVQARIIGVTATTFTYDANSPLAGENLTFSIRLIGIRSG